MTVETFTTPGAAVWQAPVGVTSVVAECWGEGGRGADTVDVQPGAGAGGGAYAKKTIVVIPGNNYNYLVGLHGNQEGSWFVDVSTVYGDYGRDALSTTAGGPGQDSIGDLIFIGGSGGDIGTTGGGGGASSGGTASVGNNGSNGNLTSGGAGGVAVTGGGAGGNGGNSNQNGSNGIQPGGGGGGSGSPGASGIGGNGGDGKVQLTYTAAGGGTGVAKRSMVVIS